MSHRKTKRSHTHRNHYSQQRQNGAEQPMSFAAPRISPQIPRINMPPPGTSPGIESHELADLSGAETPIRVVCVDYSPGEMRVEEISDLDDFLGRHRPAWSQVRWIHVTGLGRMEAIRAFAEKYQLHPLAVEDMLLAVQAPKLEDYPGSADLPGRLFIVARAAKLVPEETENIEAVGLCSEQVSLFLGRTTLLSFQEEPSTVFDPIYRRIETEGSRLRTHDASFLAHALVDAIVDSYFPVLDHYAGCLEDFDDELQGTPAPSILRKIHAVKRNLMLLRRSVWPMRELVSQLQRDKHECVSETTLTYFRDVYDHCVQIIDLLEIYREIATSLGETYMAAVSNRMNEIMKVLTVMGTIFIPLTFLAGVYGMNMPIPENDWHWSYPAFWLVCIATAAGMLFWFRRRGWV